MFRNKTLIMATGILLSAIIGILFFYKQYNTGNFFLLLMIMPAVLTVVYAGLSGQVAAIYYKTLLIPIAILYLFLIVAATNILGNYVALVVLGFPAGVMIAFIVFVIRIMMYRKRRSRY